MKYYGYSGMRIVGTAQPVDFPLVRRRNQPIRE